LTAEEIAARKAETERCEATLASLYDTEPKREATPAAKKLFRRLFGADSYTLIRE
jgi:hypothetical protein